MSDDTPQQKPRQEGDIDHIGLPVLGYRPQSGDKIAIVNKHKEMEETILRLMDAYALSMDAAVDKRWLAIARTHIEQGFMALNRAVFQPERVRLPSDPT